MAKVRVTLLEHTYTTESDEIKDEEDIRISFYTFIQNQMDNQNLDISIEWLEGKPEKKKIIFSEFKEVSEVIAKKDD